MSRCVRTCLIALALTALISLVSVVEEARAAELAFDLRIERGRVPANMRLVRVQQGDLVMLRWNADRPTILHLHGYDIEKKVEPGTVAEMKFTAHATGRFPVEVHNTSGGHAHEAPLVQIEVYPR